MMASQMNSSILPLDLMRVTGSTLSNMNTPRVDQSEEDREDVDAILSRLDEVRLNPRLPLISTICSCEAIRRKGAADTLYNSDEDSSSDSDSSQDDDDLSLCQLLKALELYQLRPVAKRKISTLKNLISSFTCKERVEDDTALMLLSLLDNADTELQVAALLIVGKLCHLEDNAFKFLFHDTMVRMLDILDGDISQHLQETAALCIKQMCQHPALEDMWMDQMLTSGLSVLLDCMVLQSPLQVRYAIAQALATLVTYHNITMLIVDHGMAAINVMKSLNSDFKEQYTLILTQLVLHTDHTRAEVLDKDALPSALYMLRQGPCRPQNQALIFLSALAQSEAGLKAVLEEKAVPYVMSALLDSHCRKVREAAASAVRYIMICEKSTFQKQVLVQVDKFFHEHEEQPLLGGSTGQTMVTQGSRYRFDTASRVQRALDDLTDAIIPMLEKEARIEKNRFGKVIQVHLTPGIDVDPVSLATIHHLVEALSNMIKYKVVKLKLKSVEMKELDDSEIKDVWRETVGGVNPVIGQLLIDHGALCVLDILHAYALNLHQSLDLPLSLPKGAAIDGTNVHSVMQAWAETNSNNGGSLVAPTAIFDANETVLISSLLTMVQLLSLCSCEVSKRDIENEVREKIEKAETSQLKSEHGSPIANKKNRLQNSANNLRYRKCPCCEARHVTIDTKLKRKEGEFSEKGQKFKKALMKMLNGMRRQIRMSLFEGGVLEVSGPWLYYSNDQLKKQVFEILRCLVRPLEERLMPKPPTNQVTPSGKRRPISAMTASEREKTLKQALFKMSSQTNELMQDALGITQPNNSPPQDDMHAKTIKEFAKELQKSGILGSQTQTVVANLLKTVESDKSSVVSEIDTAVKKGRPISAKSVNDLPPSGKIGGLRPQSAKIVSQRPQSAKSTARPQSAKLSNSRPENGNLTSKSRSDTNLRLRSNTESKEPNENQRLRLSSAGLRSARSNSSRSLSGRSNRIASSRLHSSRSLSSVGSRASSAKTRTATEALIRHLEKLGPLPWRPSVDLCEPIASQCRLRLIEVCSKGIMKQLFAKDPEIKKSTLIFLEEIVRHSEVPVHMKLSEHGLVARLVDFLRINEDQQLLEIIGLIVSRLLVTSDPRLQEAFDRHGGNDLLAVMGGYTSGPLRHEVNNTLKTATRKEKKKTPNMRAQSAPPGGRQVHHTPDIWDQITQRWQEEDRVMFLLRKDLI